MEGNMENNRKIPGMLYILVSFVPWIVYWVLCGMGNRLGVVIPLAISLLLVIPQIHKRDFNLMDLTSLLYFSTATAVTFIFNLNVFVEKSGFLGYFTLFLMALFSLIIKQPYTLQVSKRDYPEIYWKEKSFLAINNIITGVWAVIFIANATIFYLDMPSTIILSNTLIALGIAFSIVFPLKAPAYFASKEFKKYDWSVEVTQKPKGENEYDVIIVGSGIAGLSCGALLSKRGYKVLVLEQHYQVGGYCSSFKRMGFVFNTGVSDVSGLWEKGPVAYLLRELGLKREDLFVRNTIRYIFKGGGVEAQNLEEFMRKLSDMFPEEKENIYAFFDEAKKAYEECYKDLVYGIPLPAELIVKVFGDKKLLDYPKEHPHFYDWMNKTFRQKLDEYFKNEELKTLLCALLGYTGTEADKTPASNALTAVVSYYIHGGYFPRGGAQRFANSLKEVIESHGGKVLLRHKVDKILIGNGKVEGVKVGNKVFRAPIVVANANAKTTFLELVGENHLDARFVEYLKTLKMSPSCFAVFLGVDADLTEYPTIVVDLDDGYYVVINSNADPSLAPKGKASVTILMGANYYDFPERETKEYLEKKREFAEMLIKKVEKLIPNLSQHIIVQDAATPKTFERYTSMPEGAIYAFDQSIDTRRPYFKTPVRGLYLASASTFPGGGIEAVVISGMICADDICNWEIKQ
ncbi:phytoene desaturase family protein [Methermicoccus shengliensis]|uniref:NAD(P)/FAD-dependent oxidoreductase n=1 Tax=Methermicoccus shengliensis TaxID=660064 RepID=A0A832VZR4_9EURY|nr:NAD(P)/FAD-dependent oxidoreductase [Methermicoccus shengliensis]HIH69784.1 NAD(P)/FAD-dependent oxidoreductase [Methermicoccus shengliensis]